MRVLCGGLAGALGLLFAVGAEAVPIRFGCITNTSATNCATGEAQLLGWVSDAGPGRALFTIYNLGPLPAAVSDVYFDDGTLLGLAGITNGSGVAFMQWAVPWELPGANLVSPVFETTKGFSADSNLPIEVNAVNPGESVGILFRLLPGKTFNDTLMALETGELRIGVQIIAFSDPGPHAPCHDVHPCGASESFINRPAQVPEASVLALVGFGFVAVGVVVRHRDYRTRSRQRSAA